MRLRHHSGRVVHLSHGTDQRPARDLPAVVEHLDAYAAAVRAGREVDTLGVSLWLSPSLAAALAIDARSRTRLRAELDARGLEVVTLCGMPGAEGGGEAPDWSGPEILEYTLDLARVLVDLLPDDAVRGAVTTIGLGRRDGWDDAKEKACARILQRLSAGLAEVAWHHGRAVRVGFRPEPGFVLDGSSSVAAAFARLDKDRLGVSLDLASLACTWEEPAAYLDRLSSAGVSVIQARAAAAVQADDPAGAAGALRAYARGVVTNPAGQRADGVDEALRESALPGPWRVLHRVPLGGAEPPAPLTATTQVWRTALRHLMVAGEPGTEYLEIEAGGCAEIGDLDLSPPLPC